MKQDYIRIRLNAEDKMLIETNAKKKDMSMSEYIRYLVRKDSGIYSDSYIRGKDKNEK